VGEHDRVVVPARVRDDHRHACGLDRGEEDIRVLILDVLAMILFVGANGGRAAGRRFGGWSIQDASPAPVRSQGLIRPLRPDRAFAFTRRCQTARSSAWGRPVPWHRRCGTIATRFAASGSAGERVSAVNLETLVSDERGKNERGGAEFLRGP
jgi:hypothetical protein